MLFVAGPAMALDFGYSYSPSSYSDSTGNVTTNVNSFHATGVIWGSATGYNYAGGQALTVLDGITITTPAGTGLINGGSTQNIGQAVGGFEFVVSGIAGALAGTKGDVSQWSTNGSNISTVSITGSAGSIADQSSAAGFAGVDATLSGGIGSFTGDSQVVGNTYSYSYKGTDGDMRFVGTASGVGNSASTVTTGNYGSGYAGGNGATNGQSNISGGLGFTSGVYAGQFSYSGNGAGNVAGGSMSSIQTLQNGAVYGTSTNVSVNVGP